MADKTNPKKSTTTPATQGVESNPPGSEDFLPDELHVESSPETPRGGTAQSDQVASGFVLDETSGHSTPVSGHVSEGAAEPSQHSMPVPSVMVPSVMAFEILKLVLVPLMVVGAFAVGIAMLGLAQKYGWIESATGDGSGALATTSMESATSYICPMMCVPPTSSPGRCTVCAMELVPAAKGASNGPSSTIEIDPRSRRVAGIKTTVATIQSLVREVKAVGEIRYDETQLKTLSAYVDGRVEALTADYTGVNVKKGESLGRLYSPDLYSAQVEYVKTLEFNDTTDDTNERVRRSNKRLLKSSRQRLVELGMAESQIKRLESKRAAQRTLDLYAPISGTVIEKLASPGQYINRGAPIYRLADLSKVWLVLELFPEDAMAIKLGQEVKATTKSLGNQTVVGTVEFIEPMVDPKMRTVGVRVVMQNESGSLRPGEFAQATLLLSPASVDGNPQQTVVVPRNSLLSIGQTSLAYVETEPGQFQLRKIETGPSANGMVAVFSGISAGEQVVSKSTFLLDAQMQLEGNPSLIDPDKAIVDIDVSLTQAEQEEIRKAMESLSDAERTLAIAQEICPVTEVRLGSMGMGIPLKLELDGRTVFICCEGCRKAFVKRPQKYFKILDEYLSKKGGGLNVATPPSNVHPDSDLNEEPGSVAPEPTLPEIDPHHMERRHP